MLCFDIIFDVILLAVVFENYMIIASQCINKSHKKCQFNYHTFVLFCDNTSFSRLPMPNDDEKIEAQLDPKFAKLINVNSSCLDRLELDVLKYYENVVFLNASSCQLTTVAARTFSKNKKLSRLSLSWNKISSIDNDAFEGVNNLMSLNLGSNRITSISKKMFKHLTGLLSLDLSNNQLEAIPAGSIHSLAHLEVLLLNGNRLNTIGKFMLSGLRELSYFNVAGNLINSIDETFFHANPAIKRVDLSRNNITCLPQNLFKKNSQLIELFLNNNNLKVPSPHWFRKPFNADKKHARNMLSNNPWTCECSSGKYWDFLEYEVSNSEFKFVFDVECFFPVSRRGEMLSSLKKTVYKECKHIDTQPLNCNNSLYVSYPPNLPVSSTSVSLPAVTESFYDKKPDDARSLKTRVLQNPVPKEISGEQKNGNDEGTNNGDFSKNIEVPWVIAFVCGGFIIGGLFVCIGKKTFKCWKRKPQRKDEVENVESKMLNNNRDDQKSIVIDGEKVAFRPPITVEAPVACNISPQAPPNERDSGHYSPSETDRQSYFYEDPNTNPKELRSTSCFQRESSNRNRYPSETRSYHGQDLIHPVYTNMEIHRGRSSSSIPHSQTFDGSFRKCTSNYLGNQSRNYFENRSHDGLGNYPSYPTNYTENHPINPPGNQTGIFLDNQSCNPPGNYYQRNMQFKYQAYHPIPSSVVYYTG